MSRTIKTSAMALALAMAFSTIAASAADAELAPRWKVTGAFLANGATKNYTATLTSPGTLSVPGLFTYELPSCSLTGKIVGSGAKAPGTIKESVLSCEEIKVPGAPACEVSPIVTEKIEGKLGWMESTGEANVAIFEPEAAGGNFSTILVEECPLEGEYPFTGGFVGSLTPAATEAAESTLAFGGSDTPTTEHYFTGKTSPCAGARETMQSPGLLFGGRPMVLAGTFKFELTTGEKAGILAG